MNYSIYEYLYIPIMKATFIQNIFVNLYRVKSSDGLK